MKHEDLTHKIIGCAMKVHSTLGNGFQEVIYQRAMAIEMQKQGLNFMREMEMSIYYEGVDIGTRRVDFFVEDNIMVELKALIKLEEVHLAQAMNYCQAYNLPIGLLLNFGAKSLEFKRVYNLNHPENKKSSELGLNRLKNDKITLPAQTEILQSSNPKNPNSDK
ncbi:GxxExxY protein [Parasediminibacterium paludis]|uniref:GxxExxY protein n=1 Tax=Parasediminibacterium paludis TaxID=908966 RepID=A0ABV8PVA7_9BACT